MNLETKDLQEFMRFIKRQPKNQTSFYFNCQKYI